MELFILKVSSHSHHDRFLQFLIYHFDLTAREVLPLWDKQIQSICYQVNGIIEKIALAEPAWMTKTLDEEMSQ